MDDFSVDLVKFGFEGEDGLTNKVIEKYGVTYDKNRIVIKEGEKSEHVYYILKGSVYIAKNIKDSYKVLTVLGQGDLVGEMGVFEETIRSASVITKEPCLMLKFTKHDFIDIFKLHPRWVEKMLQDMSERIVTMINKL